MNSRITIEVNFDDDRKPCILIVTDKSEDVRDTLIADFIQLLGHESTLCKIYYAGEFSGKKRWKISPIEPINIQKECESQQAYMKQREPRT